MSTGAKKAFGSTFYIGSDAVEELKSVTPGEETAKTANVTSHDSADDTEEFIATVINSGVVKVAGNYTGQTGQAALYAARGGAATAFAIDLPGGAGQPRFEFSGIVTRWGWGELGVENGIEFSADVTVTGPVTLTVQGS